MILKEFYRYHLGIIVNYLEELRRYIEKDYMTAGDSEICHYNWFIFEKIAEMLKKLQENMLSERHLKRYLHHPYNALLYYQSPDVDKINVPEPLLSQF